jgi:formylglycine-generating enzyme required for sulfatase activity
MRKIIGLQVAIIGLTLILAGCGGGGGGCCSVTCATETIANAWIPIPAGDFVMGCAAADSNCRFPDEQPKHTVTLSAYKIPVHG